MLYPKNIEVKLGFDKVRELIKEECLSSLGVGFVEKMSFTDDYSLIEKLLKQTEEFRKILTAQEPFPNNNYINVAAHLEKARIEGPFLSEEEFYDLKLSLATIFKCLAFFKERGEAYPTLAALAGIVELDKSLLTKIERIIDERGIVRNDASVELQSIRREIISEQSRIRKVLESVLKQAKSQGFTGDDVSLTLRGGRMVIPVLAEHKRRIKGFVHDESATGQTVFLEPEEALEINNNIRELEYKERREIIRILTQLTNELRPNLLPLKKAYNFLAAIDFIRAKAKFALKIDGVYPELVKRTVAEWFNAKHPLLMLSLATQGKKVVPQNLTINEKQRILLISGPNAGGKSVALKTVGLIQYMIQSGLLIPVAENSRVGIFKNLFIDIGDEQSIENDLSTYSSHLKNMKHFVNFADKKTLFLIDEFGTGTEPHFGGSIAEAILDELNKKEAFGVITTHYSNLKQFADVTLGIVNAAMRFDVEHLEPLYKLEIGKPGSSFAIEIAQKIGLPRHVLSAAKANLGKERVEFDKMLNALEIDKKKFHDLNKSVGEKEERLKIALEEYNDLKDYLENQKKKILNEAKEEAKKLLKEANQKIENTIREIKEKKADKEKTKVLRGNLDKFNKELQTEQLTPERETAEYIVVGGEIKAGDRVRIKGQTAVAEVVSLKGKDAEVLIGDLKSNIKQNRLEKISAKEFKKAKEAFTVAPSVKGYDINQKFAEFSTNLDLRGKRVEEAVTELSPFIDNATMFGINELRIIHGKGDGILRKVVRDYLRGYSTIKKMRDEHPDMGGAGVTIVELK
jgi:DNA mismatch repair protein MutS2